MVCGFVRSRCIGADLSGSTYTEAVLGEFVPPEEGGMFAEVFDDATVALPLVVGAVLERIGYHKQK